MQSLTKYGQNDNSDSMQNFKANIFLWHLYIESRPESMDDAMAVGVSESIIAGRQQRRNIADAQTLAPLFFHPFLFLFSQF